MTFHPNLFPLKASTVIDDKTWVSKDKTTLVGFRKLPGIQIVLREPCTLDHFEQFPISKSKQTKALKNLFTWYAVGNYFGITVYCWSSPQGYVLYQPDGFAHHIVQHEEVIDLVEFYEYGYDKIEEALGKLKNSTLLVIDTETHGTDLDEDGGLCPFTGEMRYLQVWGDSYPDKVLIFDFGSRDQEKTYSQFSNSVQRLVEHKTIVFHNALFDLQFLSEKLGICWDTCKIRDTLLVSKLCWSGIPNWLVKHSLGAVAERIELTCHDKSFQKDDFGVNAVLPSHLNYGALDVITTRDVFFRFKEIYKGTYRVKNHPELTSVIRLQNQEIKRTEKCLVPVLSMRQSGFPVNLDILTQQIEQGAKLLEDIELELSPYLSRYYSIYNSRVCQEILDAAPRFRQELLLRMVPYLPYLEGKVDRVEFSDSSDLLVEVIHELFEISLPIKIMISKTTGEESENESTDDAALKTIENEYPELSWLMYVRKFRGLRKRIDYLDSIKRSIIVKDGIPRCFGQINVTNPQASGRMSGSSYTKSFGLNLFNSPKPNPEFKDFPVVREVFSLTGTNYSYVVCDLQGAHLQIALEQSGQLDILEEMKTQPDTHCRNAIAISQMTGGRFNTEEEYYKAKKLGDKELKTLRECAKTTIYSIINICSGKSLVTSLAEVGVFKEESECKLIIDAIWARIPKVRSFVYQAARDCIDSPLNINQEIFTPDTMKDSYPVKWCNVTSGSGRLRYFPAYVSTFNNKLQVRAPDVASTLWATIESSVILESCNRFFYEVQIARPRLRAEICMALYDEIAVFCPDEHAKEVAGFLHKIITEEWSRWISVGQALNPDIDSAIVKEYSLK
jgi:DNA polymerase family A/3'-5' exonuclease